MFDAFFDVSSKQPVFHEQTAESNQVGLVDPQHFDGGASDGSAADQLAAIVAEMMRPFVAARAEQGVSLPVSGSRPEMFGPL